MELAKGRLWKRARVFQINTYPLSRDLADRGALDDSDNKDTEVRPITQLDLLVFRIPSALRRIGAAHWVLSLPGYAGEVCADASQNLLIYVLYDISLVTFSHFQLTL
jgi:hypothetical protein